MAKRKKASASVETETAADVQPEALEVEAAVETETAADVQPEAQPEPAAEEPKRPEVSDCKTRAVVKAVAATMGCPTGNAEARIDELTDDEKTNLVNAVNSAEKVRKTKIRRVMNLATQRRAKADDE